MYNKFYIIGHSIYNYGTFHICTKVSKKRYASVILFALVHFQFRPVSEVLFQLGLPGFSIKGDVVLWVVSRVGQSDGGCSNILSEEDRVSFRCGSGNNLVVRFD